MSKIKIIQDTFSNPLSAWIVGLESKVLRKAKTLSGETCYYVAGVEFPIFRDEFIYV